MVWTQFDLWYRYEQLTAPVSMLMACVLLTLQELAVNPKPNCPQEVEFDVSSAGLTIRDTQGKTSRKEFPVKSITYVVKIRCVHADAEFCGAKYKCIRQLNNSVVELNTIKLCTVRG